MTDANLPLLTSLIGSMPGLRAELAAQNPAVHALIEANRRILAWADREEYGQIEVDPHPYLRAALIVRELREEVEAVR